MNTQNINFHLHKSEILPSIYSHILHELRISLTGIMGSYYMLDKTPLNHEQKEYLNLIHGAIDRLLTLSNTLK